MIAPLVLLESLLIRYFKIIALRPGLIEISELKIKNFGFKSDFLLVNRYLPP